MGDKKLNLGGKSYAIDCTAFLINKINTKYHFPVLVCRMNQKFNLTTFLMFDSKVNNGERQSKIAFWLWELLVMKSPSSKRNPF